jgi:hypothetical protein
MKLLLNGAKCKKCKTTVYSGSTHDFRYCSCKAIAVDGGHEYIRRSGYPDDCEEACAYEASTDKGTECKGMYLIYSPQGKTNPSTVFCRRDEALATAKDMRKRFGGSWYISGPLEPVS